MDFNYDSKEIRFSIGDEQYKLHPLWMRERSLEEGAVDQNSLQRLYDPEKIIENLEIKEVNKLDEDKLLIKFSDNHVAKYCVKNLIKEIKRAKGLPDKVFWNKDSISLRKFKFDYNTNENKQIYEILEYYHRYGFAIVSKLKPEDGEIINFAEKIGYIRAVSYTHLTLPTKA